MINEIKTKLIDKIHFDASPQEITNSMSIWMNANEGISFPSPQIPCLLGYNAKLDENGEYHIGYKMIPSFVQSISVQLRRETGRLVPFAGTGKVVLTSSALIENQWNNIMQSKHHFLISLDTTDNAAVDLALWLLVLVVLLYRLHDGLFENF